MTRPATTGAGPAPAPPAATPKRRGRPPREGPKPPPKPKVTRPGAGLTGSPEAKKKASLILEVLGGLRSPASASAVLGVSVQRYYLLEVRALQGLLAALEPRQQRGPTPSPEVATRRLAAERDRLERELLRAQALLRVAQRTVGLPPPPAPPKAGKPAPGKRGPRTPTVRARRAADALRDAAATATATATTDTTTAAAAVDAIRVVAP